ncbi:WXG100 family type VII secretion target [Nocardia amamiensis]|uniref:WXG100 family type VII secretion target n=1 Tax=Nocardia amamiensis TaxID=404578 RepID=A0ABS0CVC8_9NOCA|nr:WXG100 family type VII secretion target [Nocardia amamiensis]MBF6300561.1 WXG100 family type VII secretion target [Nocardia amamiensis]
MAGNMKYDYAAVDTNSLTFNNIVSSIMANNGDLRGMDAALRASFTGDAKQAWEQQINLLMSKLDQYNEALGRLQKVVRTVAGAGGDMHNTDKAQGGRFLAINI